MYSINLIRCYSSIKYPVPYLALILLFIIELPFFVLKLAMFPCGIIKILNIPLAFAGLRIWDSSEVNGSVSVYHYYLSWNVLPFVKVDLHSHYSMHLFTVALN